MQQYINTLRSHTASLAQRSEAVRALMDWTGISDPEWLREFFQFQPLATLEQAIQKWNEELQENAQPFG